MPSKRGRNQRLLVANVYLGGRRTSLKLEPELWECLCRICDQTKLTIDELIWFLASQHPEANLTSLIRAYVGALLLERLDQPFLLAPLDLLQPIALRRIAGVLRLVKAEGQGNLPLVSQRAS